jgi:hypothetical protein
MFSKISIFVSVIFIIAKVAVEFALFQILADSFTPGNGIDIQPSLVGDSWSVFLLLFVFSIQVLTCIIGYFKKEKLKHKALLFFILSWVIMIIPFSIIIYSMVY